jgi:hypothetical protein
MEPLVQPPVPSHQPSQPENGAAVSSKPALQQPPPAPMPSQPLAIAAPQAAPAPPPQPGVQMSFLADSPGAAPQAVEQAVSLDCRCGLTAARCAAPSTLRAEPAVCCTAVT